MFTGEKTKIGLAWLPVGAAEVRGGELDKTRPLDVVTGGGGALCYVMIRLGRNELCLCPTKPRVHLTCTVHDA